MFTNKQTKLEKAGKGGLTAKRRGQREGGQGDGKGGGVRGLRGPHYHVCILSEDSCVSLRSVPVDSGDLKGTFPWRAVT